MKSERRLERFLRRIDVIPDAERTRSVLDEILEVGEQTKERTLARKRPTERRYVMNRRLWKIAASIAVVATVIVVMEILNNGGQEAYAFEQTVEAMRKTWSYHVQTYYGSPTNEREEFWAEFDRRGKVMRLRIVDRCYEKPENPVIAIRNYLYEDVFIPNGRDPGIHIHRKAVVNFDADRLEKFDPGTLIESFDDDIQEGKATVEISDSPTPEGNIIVKITHHRARWLRILAVDPETKLVVRFDMIRLNELNNGTEDRYIHGVEVLEYNQAFDAQLFEPNFPGSIFIDQTKIADMGLEQGRMSAQDAAAEVVLLALKAWATGDFETAGRLFGAPPDFLSKTYRPRLRPADINDISVGKATTNYNGDLVSGKGIFRFDVMATYTVERGGKLEKIEKLFIVSSVEERFERWYINPECL
jgi:hypothetical protein